MSVWISDVCSSDLSVAAAHSFGNLAQRGFKLAQAGHYVSDLRHYAALTAVMSIPALNSREGTALVMSHTATSKLIQYLTVRAAVLLFRRTWNVADTHALSCAASRRRSEESRVGTVGGRSCKTRRVGSTQKKKIN